MDGSGRIQLQLLGRLSVARDAGSLEEILLSSRKAGALLAYLAMCRQQTAGREELAALLWGDSEDAKARQSLRQTLHLLRKDLGPADILVAEDDAVRLQPESVSVDALDLLALAGVGTFESLERAVGLLKGEFLAGSGIHEEAWEEWLSEQRRRFETAGARVLEDYACRCDQLRKGAQAIEAAERLVALDPLREDWQRLLMSFTGRYRGRTEALARAEWLKTELRRETGADPEPETVELIDKIASGTFVCASSQSRFEDTTSAHIEPASIGVLPPSPQLPALVQLPRSGRRDGPAYRFSHPSDLRIVIGALMAIVAVVAGMGSWLLRASSPVPIPASASAPPVQTGAIGDTWRSPRRMQSTPVVAPLLVLPFRTHEDASAETKMLADMMTDDVTNRLSRLQQIRVIGRGTAGRYKDMALDVAEIGRELGVRYVIDAKVGMRGDKLLVNVELIDPGTRAAVWSQQIERDARDRPEVEREIIERVARELWIALPTIEADRRKGSDDADAHSWRGWRAMYRAFAQSTAEAFKVAEDHFRRALDWDPSHRNARVGLANNYTNVAIMHLVPDPGTYLAKAERIVEEVLQEMPDNSSAHLSAGVIHMTRGKFAEALASFERAVEITPSFAAAHAQVGNVLTRLGRSAEALEHIHYAMRLSPRDPNLSFWHHFACMAEIELTRYQEAIADCERSTSANPSYASASAALLAANALAGHLDQIQIILQKLRALHPTLDDTQIVKRFSLPGTRRREGLNTALGIPAGEQKNAPSGSLQPPT